VLASREVVIRLDDMTRKKIAKASSNAAASAKIEAVARASYQVRKSVTEVVPPDVTRAKAGAWLDLVSPLTEWAGLKGDQLRHKRELLRLQREDTLSEIIQRASERLRAPAGTISPIPNKFMVQFLERASLEEPNSDLVDLWANLLVTASEQYSSYHVHFVNIISQISPKQGKILRSILGTENAETLVLAMDNVSSYFQSYCIQSTIERSYEKKFGRHNRVDDREFCGFVIEEMGRCGIAIVHASAERLQTEAYFDIDFEGSAYTDESEVDFSILEAVGLIRRVETEFFECGPYVMVLTYYHLTNLGFHFAMACKLVH